MMNSPTMNIQDRTKHLIPLISLVRFGINAGLQRKYRDTAKKDINDCKREVKSIKSDSMTSATFGILVNTTLSMVMDIIPGMSYIIGMDRSSNIGKDVMNAFVDSLKYKDEKDGNQ